MYLNIIANVHHTVSKQTTKYWYSDIYFLRSNPGQQSISEMSIPSVITKKWQVMIHCFRNMENNDHNYSCNCPQDCDYPLVGLTVGELARLRTNILQFAYTNKTGPTDVVNPVNVFAMSENIGSYTLILL